MQILGLGTDITEISRIRRMRERHAENFLERVFSAGEIDYCGAKKNADQHYAGRWAAKEAVMKAFGTGFIKGIHWNEIEVVSQKSGKPEVKLTGETATFAEQAGINQIWLSISHGKEYATATVITCGD